MASAGYSPSKGKRGKEDKNWKSSFLGLLSSCGSGRSKEAKQKSGNLQAGVPATPPEQTWTRVDDDAGVSKEVVTINATPGHGTDEEVEISYTDLKEIGQGTFGIVYKARLCETGEVIAIKKTLDDPKFKNRELLMMRQLEHPNILNLRYFFYTTGYGYKQGERYLNMVLDFIPETLFSVAKCDGTYSKPLLEPLYVKLYTYQVFRSLAYLHSLHISHRDVKPQNLLLNPETHVIKLCDFGSAKELLRGDTNVAYICSRYYRAPELILGATDYTCQIDVWSAGCVLAELIQGHPIFPGANGPDQMVEIIKILGTPSIEDLADINPRFSDFRFPYLAPHSWEKVLKHQPSHEAIDLIYKLLIYSPSRRITPLEACVHPFFDELRRRGTRLKNGKRLPPLFNFKPEELDINPTLNSKLQPGFDENDIDYLDSTPIATTESPVADGLNETPLNRLESLRNSFRKKIIPVIKRVSSKKGDRSETRSASDEHHRDDHWSDEEHKTTEHEYVEDREEGSETGEPDTSVTFPEIHEEPKKKSKGKRHKRANNSEVAARADDSEEVVDLSANQGFSDNTETTMTDNMESLDIQVPKKKKVPTATLR